MRADDVFLACKKFTSGFTGLFRMNFRQNFGTKHHFQYFDSKTVHMEYMHAWINVNAIILSVSMLYFKACISWRKCHKDSDIFLSFTASTRSDHPISTSNCLSLHLNSITVPHHDKFSDVFSYCPFHKININWKNYSTPL